MSKKSLSRLKIEVFASSSSWMDTSILELLLVYKQQLKLTEYHHVSPEKSRLSVYQHEFNNSTSTPRTRKDYPPADTIPSSHSCDHRLSLNEKYTIQIYESLTNLLYTESFPPIEVIVFATVDFAVYGLLFLSVHQVHGWCRN